MRNGLLLGVAIGAIMGALIIEGNAPVSEMVHKGKKAVKQKVDTIANAAKN